MLPPDRKTPRLRWGRQSRPGAHYFITLCTKHRLPCLTHPKTGNHLTQIIRFLHDSADIDLTAATIMPDHLHLLFALGDRLRLGQIMGKIKTLSRSHSRVAWRWQDDGFEHQLRSTESVKDYAFYIFMNPYRAGLCTLDQAWPWWICPNPAQQDFLAKDGVALPIPHAWVGLSRDLRNTIATRG